MSQMVEDKWRYYNNSYIPTTGPHEQAEMKFIIDKKYKKNNALFAMWPSEYDICEKKEWWYCIKDTPFDISKLKAKRRYEITKGFNHFNVEIIDEIKYENELYEAYLSVGEEYKINVDNKKEFCKKINNLRNKTIYAAFEKETNKLCGYAILLKYENYIDFASLKVKKDSEKYGINAAIVGKICIDLSDKLNEKFILSDGSRSVIHETNFQDYLEKYFGFRKAYCKLNIKYFGIMKYIVILLYPFRNIISKINHPFMKKVSGMLKLESIRRKCI